MGRFSAVSARLRRALDNHMLEIHDNGFIPEGSPLEGYDASRQGDYPLDAIMRLAASAIERDPANLPRIIDTLTHDNEVMRFWAVLGCRMLSEHARPAAAELTRMLRTDPSVHVRIAVAEALAGLDLTAESVPFLAQALHEQTNERVKLQALNALTNIGERATPALPQIVEATASPDEYVSEAARYLARVLTHTYVPSP
jgi:hypothetical protein